jgi:hypothetical protein
MKYIEFEDVPANRYKIDERGRVWDEKRERWLVQSICPLPTKKPGYVSVGFWLESKKIKRKYVHRLVAAMYVPNPEGKPEVNHKDGVKTNNHFSNLEWVTKSENHYHSHRTGLATVSRVNLGKKLPLKRYILSNGMEFVGMESLTNYFSISKYTAYLYFKEQKPFKDGSFLVKILNINNKET